MTGCGGGGGGGGSTGEVTAPPLSGGAGSPTITGTPKIAAVVGQEYIFQPQAADPDGDRLTFSIKSKPSWAQFDAATGRLSGTPLMAHLGVHEAIEITVSDGRNTASLPPFAVMVSETAVASVTLAWNAPTENDDGTPLTDLKGYRLYYGEATQNYAGTIAIDNANMTQHVVDTLPKGTYYFAITAVNGQGLESVYSTEVKTTI